MPDRLSDIINVKDWGAKGNASTNDTAAIQAAINYAIGPRSDGTKGGIVFFPAGQYHVSSIYCGSDTVNNSSVRLIGAGASVGHQVTVIKAGLFGGSPTWTLSSGGRLYDCIESVENIALSQGGSSGSLQVTRSNVAIISCKVIGPIGIDASQAKGAYITNCYPLGPGNSGAASGPGKGRAFPPANTLGMVVTDNALITGCRTTNGWDICYAVSGSGANLIGNSCENQGTGVRLGWGLIGGVPSEIPAIGCTVQSHQNERTNVDFDLYNCQGCAVISSMPNGGDGTPEPHGNVTGGSYTGTTATIRAPRHNIPTGTPVMLQLQFLNNNTWIPSYGSNPRGFISATVVDANHFSYTLTPAPVGSLTTGTWNYPQAYGFRFRKVSDTLITTSHSQSQKSIADFDFDYGGDVNAIQNNNVITSISLSPMSAGFILPRGANKAAWKFIQVLGATNLLASDTTSLIEPFGVAASAARVSCPDCTMVFNDLPGQTTNQAGPFEGQEYTITDCTLTSAGNWSATVGVAQSGSENHVKLRYSGAAWTISG
jgi:hypothetical protein